MNATSPEIVYIYSTYTPARKAGIQRYRATEKGRLANRAASKRCYERKKANHLLATQTEDPVVTSSDDDEV